MPYIKQGQKDSLKEFGNDVADNPGELNYLFTFLINNYIDAHRLSYQTINDIIGALEGAKLEFYRRVVAPYEDTKIQENGDVY